MYFLQENNYGLTSPIENRILVKHYTPFYCSAHRGTTVVDTLGNVILVALMCLCVRLSKKFNLKEPVEKITVTVPRSSRIASTQDPQVRFTPKEKLRKEFYEIVDLLVNELKRRFDQCGMKKLIKLENVILSSIKQDPPSPEELQLELVVHSFDFNIDLLYAQLLMFKTVIPEDNISGVVCIARKLKNKSAMVQTLLRELKKLIMLILTIPASTASSERSFSDLRCLKTYLRANVSQERLNHLLVAQIHGSR
ncbi:hypothetical protein PR048_023119 [Dryococelus australis]|uniref:HAT C-terminal dimerisation domain-containing protein n=1 Tax=Dryococelus australis TaxID=614101 RepID=A0ABQ9GT65_9NEOP|nr:hypothetical protein PR048_023119 [Dryococelus australis]